RPKLFHLLLECLLLFRCMYLARSCLLMYSMLDKYGSINGSLLCVAAVLPVLLSWLVLQPRLFQWYSVLLSVSQIEPNILGNVLEEMMNQTRELRTELVMKLRGELGPQGKEGLKEMFESFDQDSNGVLSAAEFSQALSRLGLFWSRHQVAGLLNVFSKEPMQRGLRYKDFL
ncbi:unnamed protein product, partial [Chrysoparadoxa australica]